VKLFAVEHRVGLEARTRLNGHPGLVLWLTGLSGSGKSTISLELEARLVAAGRHAYLLDGDNVRHGLNADLGFSPEDRTENIRRVGEVAALMADAGLIVIAAFISPYRADRSSARAAVARLNGPSFHEVHVSAPIDVCEARDPKGLYQKARSGQLPEFTGISAPYEPPEAPELTLDTASLGVDAAVETTLAYLDRHLRS
jgi:bifunctional enzyme CysN/CysC